MASMGMEVGGVARDALVMETRKRVLGEDYSDTLNRMANLASTFGIKAD
jgi:hypothetical protein